jgi:predicted nucleic acid-binding Zn ribbon protein
MSTPRKCIACGTDFLGDPKAMTCSLACRQARRRGRAAGVDALPPPTVACEICGKVFRRERNTLVCSAECRRTRKQRRWRENYYARVAVDPDLARRNNARRRERAAVDSEYAAKMVEWDRKKHARHRRKMAADPAYAERHRARHREHYRTHADEIQAKRKARVEAMTDAELAERIESCRYHSREWRRRRRADPEKAEADRIAFREWTRRKNRDLFQTGMGVLLAAAHERLSGRSSHPARPCEICGGPILGRHPTAFTCSDECQWQRTLAKRYPERPRPCLVCGATITARTSALTCSDACRMTRKSDQRKRLKDAKGNETARDPATPNGARDARD